MLKSIFHMLKSMCNSLQVWKMFGSKAHTSGGALASDPQWQNVLKQLFSNVAAAHAKHETRLFFVVKKNCLHPRNCFEIRAEHDDDDSSRGPGQDHWLATAKSWISFAAFQHLCFSAPLLAPLLSAPLLFSTSAFQHLCFSATMLFSTSAFQQLCFSAFQHVCLSTLAVLPFQFCFILCLHLKMCMHAIRVCSACQMHEVRLYVHNCGGTVVSS